MPRRTTTKTSGIGKAIESDRRKQQQQPARAACRGVAERQAGRSVLESNSLDDYLAANELAKATIEVTRGEWNAPVEGPRLVCLGERIEAASGAEAKMEAAKQVTVPIPRRPQWEDGESAESLADREGEAFLEWRRQLAHMEEQEGLIMTPYERNLDFWRQLWRTLDRSDMLVQILDARDPEFYRCRDLEACVRDLPNKRHLLLINKADYLTPELRKRWAAHFAAAGTDVIFFSALRELKRQQGLSTDAGGLAARAETEADAEGLQATEADDAGLQAAEASAPPRRELAGGPQEDFVMDVEALVAELQARLPAPRTTGVKVRSGVVGFVGYPNVGKSSVINCLFGAKKVSMSRRPGKTKHLQTLEMHEIGLTLCDCPGLVFPSIVATKAHLTINGTTPLDELRDALPPIMLVVEKIGVARLMNHYYVTDADMREGAARRDERASASLLDQAHNVLAGLATARKKFIRCGVPDETWAARRVLQDFVTGELLHCEVPRPPLGSATAAIPAVARVSSGAPAEAGPHIPHTGDDSDFSDLDEFLQGIAGPREKTAGKGRKKR